MSGEGGHAPHLLGAPLPLSPGEVGVGSGKLFPKNHLLFYSFILKFEPIILSKLAHYSQIILNFAVKLQ